MHLTIFLARSFTVSCQNYQEGYWTNFCDPGPPRLNNRNEWEPRLESLTIKYEACSCTFCLEVSHLYNHVDEVHNLKRQDCCSHYRNCDNKTFNKFIHFCFKLVRLFCYRLSYLFYIFFYKKVKIIFIIIL